MKLTENTEKSKKLFKEIKTELAHLRLQVNVITKSEYCTVIKKIERYIEELEENFD